MKILIISVGKPHDKFLKDYIEVFENRLSSFFDISWKIIPTSTKINEGKFILRFIKDDYVALLDEKGKETTSHGFGSFLEARMNEGTKRLVFVIGGAFGSSDDIFSRADTILSLSKLILPHMLVRTLLIEQIYRAHSIIKGGKYHHE